MNTALHSGVARLAVAALAISVAATAHADVITDWNNKANDIVVESKLGTPPAIRVMAMVQTAVNDAVSATRTLGTAPASMDAAVAAANRGVLVKLLPNQQAMIETAYQAALSAMPEGAARSAGVAAGEQAAAAVLAQRAGDTIAPDTYRPYTMPGIYVPTAAAAATPWPQRKPWNLSSPAQVRPAAPPALASDAWARDYNEIRESGARNSTKRSAEQTDIARFWEYSLPPIYYGIVRSVALQPGRDVMRNAQLYAAVAQAMDDAMIAVFEAKYHYNFWRPTTAIRNGDIDGNDATPRDAGWLPLIDSPMHPEYPSGHAILASAVGAVIKMDIGNAASPTLATSSPTAKGATRRWASTDEFVREVCEARVYAGIHFRSAVETGADMGRRIGELSARRLLQGID